MGRRPVDPLSDPSLWSSRPGMGLLPAESQYLLILNPVSSTLDTSDPAERGSKEIHSGHRKAALYNLEQLAGRSEVLIGSDTLQNSSNVA